MHGWEKGPASSASSKASIPYLLKTQIFLFANIKKDITLLIVVLMSLKLNHN